MQRSYVEVVAAGGHHDPAVAGLEVVGRVEAVPAVVPPLDPCVRLARRRSRRSPARRSGAGSPRRSAPGCRSCAARRAPGGPCPGRRRRAGPRPRRPRWRRRWSRTVLDLGMHERADARRGLAGRRGCGRDSRTQRGQLPGGATSGGSGEVLGPAVGDLGRARSSQPSAGSDAGGRSVCTVDDGGDRHRLVRVEHLEGGDVVAEVVAVVVGPRRRRHLEPGVHDDWPGPSAGVIRAWLYDASARPSYSKPVVWTMRSCIDPPSHPVCALRAREVAGETASVAASTCAAAAPSRRAGRRSVGSGGTRARPGRGREALCLVGEAGALAEDSRLSRHLGPVQREDTDRGKSRSSSRNSAASAVGFESPGTYAGTPPAPAARNRVDHGGDAAPGPHAAGTIRAVMSTRSRERPAS